MRNLIFALFLASLMVGCATVGRKLDQSSVEKIKKGETTQEQVIALIGSPDQMTRDGSGNVTFSYMYARATAKGESFIPIVGAFAGGANVKTETVMVSFGPDHVVKEVISTIGATESGVGISAASAPSTNDMKQVQEAKRPQ